MEVEELVLLLDAVAVGNWRDDVAEPLPVLEAVDEPDSVARAVAVLENVNGKTENVDVAVPVPLLVAVTVLGT